MAGTISAKRRVGEKLLMPIVAAGTSAAVGYVVKRAPGFVEDEVLPRVREAVQGDGGLREKVPAQLPDRARSVVSGGGELAEQLVDRAKDVTGIGERDDSESAATSTLSQEELSRRSEERARRRAKRRKTTTSK